MTTGTHPEITASPVIAGAEAMPKGDASLRLATTSFDPRPCVKGAEERCVDGRRMSLDLRTSG
jgi:hypothetical protein